MPYVLFLLRVCVVFLPLISKYFLALHKLLVQTNFPLSVSVTFIVIVYILIFDLICLILFLTCGNISASYGAVYPKSLVVLNVLIAGTLTNMPFNDKLSF